MTLFLYPCSPNLPLRPSISSSAFPHPTIFLSFKPISSYRQRKPISAEVPARDRIVDFGKYRGKMLGTLPSKYLKWVSKNLRARDFEEWAKLADEVLEDPVYKDRLEWEFAEKLLNGDDSRTLRSENAVLDLLEISQRFGWDNEDKAAWSRVDFGLLGTSKGGRIPRVGEPDGGKPFSGEMEFCSLKMGKLRSLEKESGLKRGRKAAISRDESAVRGIEETVSLEKGLALTRQRKMGDSSRASWVSQIQEADAGLEGHGRLGYLGRNSRLPRIEEIRFLEIDSESRKERRPGFLSEEPMACNSRRMGDFEGRKVGFLSKGVRFYDANEEDNAEEEISRGRREDRRERQRLRRGLEMQRLKKEVGLKEERGVGNGIQKQNRKGFSNPFPGREALLRKANRQH